jgi:hypothetical protein
MPGLLRSIAITSAAIACALSAPGRAAPPQEAPPPTFKRFAENLGKSPQVRLSDDGETLYIVGSFDEGAYLRVAEVAEPASRLRRVYLASYGGVTIEGRMIGLYIRRRGLDTYVEQVCASACTMAFIAGRERVAGPAAKIGFHQGFSLNIDGSIEVAKDGPAPYAADRGFPVLVGVSGTALMRQAFEIGGVEGTFIDRALATPSETMWYPEPAELRSARVESRFAAQPELPPPPGIGSPRAEIDEELSRLPLWQALRAYSPDTFEAAAEEVWRGVNTGLRPSIARWAGRAMIVEFALKELPVAPDPLLDATILLYGDMARSERQLGYASCRPAGDLIPKAPNPEIAAYAAREDALMIRLFTEPARAPRMSGVEATKVFRKAAKKLAAGGHFDWLGEGDEADCRSGLQALEAIAELEPRRRPSAYRAMLSLPPDDGADDAAAGASAAGETHSPDEDRNRH